MFGLKCHKYTLWKAYRNPTDAEMRIIHKIFSPQESQRSNCIHYVEAKCDIHSLYMRWNNVDWSYRTQFVRCIATGITSACTFVVIGAMYICILIVCDLLQLLYHSGYAVMSLIGNPLKALDDCLMYCTEQNKSAQRIITWTEDELRLNTNELKHIKMSLIENETNSL